MYYKQQIFSQDITLNYGQITWLRLDISSKTLVSAFTYMKSDVIGLSESSFDLPMTAKKASYFDGSYRDESKV